MEHPLNASTGKWVAGSDGSYFQICDPTVSCVIMAFSAESHRNTLPHFRPKVKFQKKASYRTPISTFNENSTKIQNAKVPDSQVLSRYADTNICIASTLG